MYRKYSNVQVCLNPSYRKKMQSHLEMAIFVGPPLASSSERPDKVREA